jgi:hypothetical protein
MRILTLLTVLCGIASAQSSRIACTVPASVAKEVQALPLMTDLSRSWEERMAPRRALAKKNPATGRFSLLFKMRSAGNFRSAVADFEAKDLSGSSMCRLHGADRDARKCLLSRDWPSDGKTGPIVSC